MSITHLASRIATRITAPLALLVAVLAWASPAAAVNSAYVFTGICFDCTGTGTGTLILKDYTPGATLEAANFVSFSYASNLLSYTLTDVLGMMGSLTTTTGPAYVTFASDTWTFSSLNFGAVGQPWCTGAVGNCGSDFGLNSSWAYAGILSGVPEVASWAMMVVGFGVAGYSLRRRRPDQDTLGQFVM